MNYSSVRIRNGDKEPIVANIIDEDENPLTGKTDIKIKIYRSSDGKFFDWDDNTFKDSGSVTQKLEALEPVNNTDAPGDYQLDTTDHNKGFDTSQITNPINGFDVYQFIVVQDGGTDAENVPQYGEIHVGGYVDNLDEKNSVLKNDLELIKDGGAANFDPIEDNLHALSNKLPDMSAIIRLLGLNHENAVIDKSIHDANNQLVSARLRVYDSKTNAEAATDGGSETQGLIATYTMATVWEGINRMGFFRMVLEP